MKKIIYTFIAASALAMTSCNDSFMDLKPDTTLTAETVFSNYNTFKTYAWSLYEVFDNYNMLRRPSTGGNYKSALLYNGDLYAGWLMWRQNGEGNPYAFQNISNVTSGNGWDFDYIRQVNTLIDHVEDGNMSEAEKEHWRSVGYFFRAYYYAELIARFGDVPWVDHVLGDTDEVIYGPRTPRKEVADHVLEDLLYAEEHIKVNGDGDNTINRDVVRALISRFCLFEGTWRKYHGLGDEEKHLKACADASAKLMADYPTLNSDWGETFTTEDLSKTPGIILYKQYIEKELTNYVLGSVERTSTHNVEMPQHIIDMYLCQDGKTISNSPEYEWGKTDKTMYSTFRNRDRRLLEIVMPPYECTKTSDNYYWDYVDYETSEYMDILGTTDYTGYGGGNGESGKHKVYPIMNWAGNILTKVPHFSTNNGGVGFCVARSGNYVWKFYNVWDDSREGKGTADVPLFKIDEVMLNYAEAMYELGKFTQDVADKTINKLRQRAEVADMIVDQINDAFDPKRDEKVNPVLWEIRRERMVELMGEGFGFYDIRRWKRADWYVNKIQYGQWATKEQIGANGKILNEATGFADPDATEGYIWMYNDPVKSGKGWLEKYYLYMVPTNERALNPALSQNPGWED